MKRLITFAVLIGGCVGLVPATASCNASSAQIHATESDGLKLAACILSEVFGGVTDPAAIGAQCAGALPAVIVDVINDFEAKASDGGAMAASPGVHAEGLLDEAKQKALAAEHK